MDLAKVRELERVQTQYAYIAGTVHHEPSDTSETADWLVVYVLKTPCDDDWRELERIVDARTQAGETPQRADIGRELAGRLRDKVRLADHVVLQRSGFWYVRVAPGCYGVGAFADTNRNLHYDDEPLAAAIAGADRLVELGAGERREGIDLAIDPGARMAEGFSADVQPLRGSQFRSHQEQLVASLGEVTVLGEVADLSDPRFGPESGRLGYFDIYRFLWEVGPGIYFLEPYDPERIPVLFVHGALGFPQSFEPLIANLDRSRFQPWVVVYPSGSRLAPVADYLSRNVATLQLRLGFERMAVVAHSMGGLVARAFILRHHETMVDDPVELFVSISTPWAGDPAAAAGVERSPFVVPSWRDVQPNSPFLAELFFQDPEQRGVRRHLPDSVAFYLLFGVEDETVPLASAVRWEAAREARERWPLDYDHTAILGAEETSLILNEILDRELR